MNKNASKEIAEHQIIILKDDIFTQFIAACDQASKPNDRLKAALELSRHHIVNTNSPN